MSSQVLRIVLDSTDHGNYTAGDLVKGVVVLENKLEGPVERATIQFVGLQKFTLGRAENAFDVKTTLFNQTINLFDGGDSFGANETYEWPFEFTFPDVYRPLAPYADEEQPEPLPPCLYDRDVDATIIHICSVKYDLIANVTRPKPARLKKGQQCKLHLTYVQPPSRETGLQDAHKRLSLETFEVKTASVGQERRPSLKEKTSSIFKPSSSLQSHPFELVVKTYDTLRIGQSMPLSVSIRWLSETTNPSNAPIVSLKEIWPTIRGVTAIWINDGVRCGAEGIKCPVRYTYTRTLGQGFNAFLDECDYNKDFLLDAFWQVAAIPSFTTANLSRTYQLILRFTVGCAGKTFKMEVQHPLEVLPGPPRGDRAGPFTDNIGLELLPAYTTDHIPSDPLPSYQEEPAGQDIMH